MQRSYYLFNQIFNNKNVKLKNLFKILCMTNIIWYYSIQNTIVGWIILRIFDVIPNNILDFGINIYSINFENMFF